MPESRKHRPSVMRPRVAEPGISRGRLPRLGCKIPLANTAGLAGRISPPHQPMRRNRPRGGPGQLQPLVRRGPPAFAIAQRRRHQSPRTRPSFGWSALHQIAGAVLAASDRVLPSQSATRIPVVEVVEARFQSHVAGLAPIWNMLPGPVLLAAAPLIANPGRRWLNSHDHRLAPLTG